LEVIMGLFVRKKKEPVVEAEVVPVPGIWSGSERDKTEKKEKISRSKSRWGYHPCDYETFMRLKKLHKWVWEQRYAYARWRRWSRKEPQNRVVRHRAPATPSSRANGKMMRGAVIRVDSIPEPKVASTFKHSRPYEVELVCRDVVTLYRQARMPATRPILAFSAAEFKTIEETELRMKEFPTT
jgi:hypothetical protein